MYLYILVLATITDHQVPGTVLGPGGRGHIFGAIM